jgi:hypothetical protein
MNGEDYVRAVEKWERSWTRGRRGWSPTAGTCGQHLRPDDAVKVKVARKEDTRNW